MTKTFTGYWRWYLKNLWFGIYNGFKGVALTEDQMSGYSKSNLHDTAIPAIRK